MKSIEEKKEAELERERTRQIAHASKNPFTPGLKADVYRVLNRYNTDFPHSYRVEIALLIEESLQETLSMISPQHWATNIERRIKQLLEGRTLPHHIFTEIQSEIKAVISQNSEVEF